MAEKFNSLGLISATRTEFSHLSNLLAETGFTAVNSQAEKDLDWISGEFFSRRTLLIRSGVGKTSAAMAAQFLVDRFKPEIMVNLGAAGGLNPDLKPGCVILAHSCQEWDVECLQALAPVLPLSVKELNPILSVLMMEIFTGKIITGDTFVADQKQRLALARKFSAVAVDMESAAIAKVATANGSGRFTS